MPTLLLQGKSCESTQLPYGAASGKLSLESSINLDWHSLCRCAGRQGRGQESVQAGIFGYQAGGVTRPQGRRGMFQPMTQSGMR